MSKTALKKEQDKESPPANTPEAGDLKATFETVADNRVRIGFLLGNDITTLIAANTFIRPLVKSGFKPVIYLAEHRPSKKEHAKQAELQDFSFYERYLLNNVVKPVLKKHGEELKDDDSLLNDHNYTLETLADYYGLDIESVPNINAPAFVEKIKNESMMPLLISTRCYQIAHDELIAAQKNKKFNLRNGHSIGANIWNLHPGKLPEFQGIFSPLYAMADGQRTAAWTLHEIVYDKHDPHKGIDKGPIITRSTAPIDYRRPAIHLYTDFAEHAGRMVYDRIEDFMSGGVPTTPQQDINEDHQYYSHPTPEFLKDKWSMVHDELVKAADIGHFYVPPALRQKVANDPGTAPLIADPDEMLSFYLKSFTTPGSKLYDELKKELKKEIENWEKNKHVYVAAHNDKALGAVDSMLMSGQSFLDCETCSPKPANTNVKTTKSKKDPSSNSPAANTPDGDSPAP